MKPPIIEEFNVSKLDRLLRRYRGKIQHKGEWCAVWALRDDDDDNWLYIYCRVTESLNVIYDHLYKYLTMSQFEFRRCCENTNN